MRFPTFLHVANEGWGLICAVLACAGAAVWLGAGKLALAAGAIAAVLLLGFFREPERIVPPYPLGILTPADGVVVHRRECHDPFLDRAAIRIGLRLDRLGAYYFRAPIEGTLLEVRPTEQSPLARKASWIQTDEKDDLILIVSEGLTFGARPCQQPYGQRVGQGRRCGRRRLARRIDLYLPAESRVEVEVGDRVFAGSDRLATLLHQSAPSVVPPLLNGAVHA